MQFNVHAAKTNLSKLIDAALAGEKVVIARDSVPLVELVPYKKKKFKFDVLKGIVNTVPDFFEPMSEEDLLLWEGEGDSPEKHPR
jgi:antitoxin (DNA-binding transcriptional repressor) of toxin-antitoxin stability system